MKIPFYQLAFDSRGLAQDPAQLKRLIAESRLGGVTDMVFLAHGFRCDAAEASDLFAGLVNGFNAHLDREEFATSRTTRRYAAVGIYWPSQEFRESGGSMESLRFHLAEIRRNCSTQQHADALDQAATLLDSVEFNRVAQDRFVACVLSLFDHARHDRAEGLPLIGKWRGSDILRKLRTGIVPVRREVEGGIESLPVLSSLLYGLGMLLNFTTWTAMKNLAGKVGAVGLAEAVRRCKRELDHTRIHLAGHSLGGRLVTACCKALGPESPEGIESLTLLEPAFSHFGFSPDDGMGRPGFFREVIDSRVVRGALISTFSKKDDVVGTAYAVASRLVGDHLQSVGDAGDPYGGMGHNGAQRTPEAGFSALHRAGSPYAFEAGSVTCLDGSAGTINGHSDVTNEHVTYAFTSALASAITSFVPDRAALPVPAILALPSMLPSRRKLPRRVPD